MDQYHLTVYWSEHDGWVVSEMEPSSDGFIWNDNYDQWRYAESDKDHDIFAKMTERIVSLNVKKVEP